MCDGCGPWMNEGAVCLVSTGLLSVGWPVSTPASAMAVCLRHLGCPCSTLCTSSLPEGAQQGVSSSVCPPPRQAGGVPRLQQGSWV